MAYSLKKPVCDLHTARYADWRCHTRGQDEDETDPWHVTATHSGDRTADGGAWQEVTIELPEVASNVHSIYVLVKTRNGLTLNHVDPEQLEFSATSDSTGGSHRRLPCELPALALTRRTDCAIVARLVRTRKHRRHRSVGDIVEHVVDGWGCQPLPLAVEPFRGLPQHNTTEKAFRRAVEAIQTFLRNEAASSKTSDARSSSVRELSFDDVGRPSSPTRTRRSRSRSPQRPGARTGAARANTVGPSSTFDLGVSTPVRCIGRWRHSNPLDICSLMFGWDNRFLPDTHLDRNRDAIEWSV